MKRNASCYEAHLKKIPWSLFCTLTFLSDKYDEGQDLARWFSLIRRLARRHHLYFKKLVWCLRLEYGPSQHRPHFHCLIANLPRYCISPTATSRMGIEWTQLGGGDARIERYDPDRDGVGYILKGWEECLRANAEQGKESAKLGPRGVELMLSEGLKRLLRAIVKRESASRTLKSPF